MNARHAEAHEHVLLAPERRLGVIDDAEQLLYALLIFANLSGYARHAEEALRPFDGRIAAVETRWDENRRRGIVGVDLPEIESRRGNAIPAVGITTELTGEERVLRLLDGHRRGVRVEHAGVVQSLHVLDGAAIFGRFNLVREC